MKSCRWLAAGLAAMCISTTERVAANWDTAAWPSCEHTGKLWLDGSNLYRQVWAADVFAALSERAAVVHNSGWAGITGGTTSSWWRTEAGVRAMAASNEHEALSFFRHQTAVLAQYFVNPAITNVVDHLDRNAVLYTNTVENVIRFYGCDVVPQEHTNDIDYLIYYDREDLDDTWYDGLLNFDLPEGMTRGIGTNLTDTAGVPIYLFEPHATYGATAGPPYLTPKRLRGGLCDDVNLATPGLRHRTAAAGVTQVVDVIELDTVTAESPCGGDIDAGILRPFMNGLNGSRVYDLPYANKALSPTSYVTREPPVTSETWAPEPDPVDTNTLYRLLFEAEFDIAITNNCAGVATNVAVDILVTSEVEIVYILDPGGRVQWNDWRRNPVRYRAASMEEDEVYTVTLGLRFLRPLQDNEARTSNIWYHADFGWDALRKVINEMDATVRNVQWVTGGESNETLQVSAETNSYAAAKAAITTDDTNEFTGGSPNRNSYGYYVGESFDCDEFNATRDRQWFRPKVNLDGLTVAFPEFEWAIYARHSLFENFDQTLLTWEELDTGSTNDTFTAAIKVADGGWAPWPEDPSTVPGWEEPRDANGETYSNVTSSRETWEQGIAVLEWLFEFDED